MNPDYIIGGRNPQVIYANLPQGGGDDDSSAPTRATSTSNLGKPSTGDAKGNSERELSFGEFLDVINPLQHIPIVSEIYRAVTGETISGFAKVAGGAIFGGPIGLVTGVVDAVFTDETGKSAPETFIASLFGSGKPKTTTGDTGEVMVASNDAPEAPEKLNTQVASATAQNVPATLDDQLAAAKLPPMNVPPIHVASSVKQPYGGVMNLAAVPNDEAGNAAPAEATSAQLDAQNKVPATLAEQEAQGLANAKAAALARQPLDHPPTVQEGLKFYSLANARRMGGQQVAMPINPGPDVRLKPISRQAYAAPTVSQPNHVPNVATIHEPTSADAQRALGLQAPTAQAAELEGGDALSPGDADLLPGGSGGASDPVPNALIEDMMKMGLDKYQKGLQNGTISAPGVDVRG